LATAQTAELFKPMQFDRQAYIEQVYAGANLYPQIGEVQAVPMNTPAVANKLTTVVKDYALSVELSKDLFDDNLHGAWTRTVEDMAMKLRRTQDSEAMGWFRGAFTTSLTADGAAFCGTHTTIKGGAVVNFTSGAGSALSGTSLNTAIVALAEQKDQAGVIMGCQPSILLVPPALFKKALEETQSALYADNSNNAINVYRSAYGLKVYQSPYLGAAAGGSDTAWFLLAKNHTVTRIIRQGAQTALRDWTYSNNRTYLYQANFREVVYAPDYIGVYGNVGA
jgi:phage major head subunit gpT-like protein